MKYLVGIDEAGRGPVAGPVIVAAFCVWAKNDKELQKLSKELLNYFPNKKIKDSKKLSEKKREEIFKKLEQDKEMMKIDFKHHFSSNKVIDKRGISYAIKNSLKFSLKKLSVGGEITSVLLDGSLKAPENFKNQRTIIKGDEKEAIIALASIVAKVTRDREMIKIAKKFPNYGLDVHKGYGTRFHYESIEKYGISPIHRQSFLKIFLSNC